MKTPWPVLALLAASAAACSPQSGTRTEQAVPAPSEEEMVRMAGFLAKSLCSGLWVNGRERGDFLRHDILLAREAVTTFDLVEATERRAVSAVRAGSAVRTAVFHEGHGCTILAPDQDDVMFDPVPVEPDLPDADTTPWPMGELLPEEPLPSYIDGARLEEAVSLAFEEEDPSVPIVTRALVVVHRGRLIAERYADGFDRSSVMIGWSMGKSLAAALVGILVEWDWLEVDAPAPIAEWQTEGDPRGSIRILDLLQMSGGLAFDRIEPTEPRFFSADNHHFNVYFDGIDTARWASLRDARHPPGTVGVYRNSDPLTLGRIVRETVEAHGEDYLTFPQRALFDRIGARSMVLERDPWGNAIISGFDHGTARDYARFGLLHAQDGVFAGERILPEGWVKLVSTPAPGWEDKGYGGQFWLNAGGRWPEVPVDAFMARGAFGQATAIIRSEDLVVVRMGYSLNSAEANLAKVIAALVEALDVGEVVQ